jgi:uncharacterized protein involved in exopolysaccharide biosynthesis
MADEDLIRWRAQPPAPTARELVMVLFRRRKVFVCVSALVVAGALYYAFAGARYQAEMKLLIRPGRADSPASAQENAPLDLTRIEITEEELNSEVEMLRDEDILRKVVEENGLAGRDWLHFLRLGEGDAERVERAARRLAGKIDVDPVKKTNLISVSYSSTDPRRAAGVLRSLANAYIEKHAGVHRPGGELVFFEQQTKESRRQLEEANRNLLDFMAGRDVVVASEQRDRALLRWSDEDALYRQTSIELAETQQRVSELRTILAKLPERTTTQVRIADNAGVLTALKSRLQALQEQRIQLLVKFEPGHRLVQEVEQEIAQAQAAIAAENLAPVRDETTDRNTHYEWAKGELQQSEVQLKSLQARASAARMQESAYSTIASKLGRDAIAQEDLQRTEKAAEENYLLYVKKQEEARMADALDRQGIVNVAIAEEPVAPALPRWSTFTVLLVGLTVASAAGAGAAFTADYVDPAFRTPDDALAYLNAPVLASLPRAVRGRLAA